MKPLQQRTLSPAFKRGALSHLLTHQRNATNFKLAKSFEEGAAGRSFYKDRSEGNCGSQSLCLIAYSDLSAALRGEQGHAEQGRDLQLPHHGVAGVPASIYRLRPR